MARRPVVVLSVLFCGAILALWVRSLRVSDEFSLLTHADTRYALATHPHGLDLRVETHFRSYPPTWNPISIDLPADGWKYYKLGYYGRNVGLFSDAPPAIWWDPPAHYFAGVGYDASTQNWTYPGGTQIFKRTTDFDAPFWLIVLMLFVPSIVALARKSRRRKRLRFGRCLSCGYDLRGSSGRCPECGRADGMTVVAPASCENQTRVG